MNPERALLLLLIVPLLCGMRDPFAPAIDTCQTAQLANWHYRGGTQSAQRLIAVMQNNDGRWQRVEAEQTLSAGWRIKAITLDSLIVETGEGCEPLRWQWKREGTTDDQKDKPVRTDAVAASVEPSEKHHAGGGRRTGRAAASEPR
ncbi:HofP DNA utilization family protein [Kluyvera ascorbata]|uniref:HofP DNA utilization family protein n=1 Tax=Kluyvera ascorbata TaxID=51288 RepID=A0AB35XC74_9ENTR